MKFKAKDLLVEWYRPFEPAPSNELLNARSTAIKKIVENDQIEYWLDMVRIYYGLSPIEKKNLELFVSSFRESDASFPVLNNQELMKMLAGASLCHVLENDEPLFNPPIALAILNCNFLGQYESYDKVEVTNWAVKALLNEAKYEVEDDDKEGIETLESSLGEDSTYVLEPSDQLLITKTLKTVINKNIKLSEEVNVLWWLFGETSTIENKHFSDLTIPEVITYAAMELADLTTISHTFASAKALLTKALLIGNKHKPIKQKYTVYGVVNAISVNVRKRIVEEYSEAISALTPCLSAVKKSLEFPSGHDWSESFKHLNKDANIRTEFAANEVSYQLYKEITFVKSI